MVNKLNSAQLKALHAGISGMSDRISQIRDVVEDADQTIFMNSSTITNIINHLIAQGFPTTPVTPNSYGQISFTAKYKSIALKRVHNLQFCQQVADDMTALQSPGNVGVTATIETLPIDPAYQQVG